MLSRRSVLALVAALAGLVAAGWADPVAADPARPTDFRSQVVSIDPPLPPGVELEVVGGDAFLQLHVSPGHTAAVPDYEQARGEPVGPYLRFRADGVVERDESSLAARVNEDRYGSDPGSGWEPGADPRWRQVASGGRYAWHDHRIHWMLERPPTAVDPRGRVDLGGPDGTWALTIEVDGVAHEVRGELLLEPAPSPLPWLGIGAAAALGLLAAVVGWTRPGRAVRHLALALGLVGSGLLAVGVASAAWRSLPPGTGPGPTSTLIAVAGTLLAAVAAVALRTGRAAVARVGLAGAVAALGSWAVLRRDVLTHAVLPTDLAYGVDRGVTAAVLGAAVSGAVVLVWRPPAAPRASTPPAGGTPGPFGPVLSG